MREGRVRTRGPGVAPRAACLENQGVSMRRALVFLGAALLVTFGAALAQQKENPQEAPPPNVPADDAAKKNPVKSTTEGLADAKKLFGYHCAMCHGAHGDGKGAW